MPTFKKRIRRMKLYGKAEEEKGKRNRKERRRRNWDKNRYKGVQKPMKRR